MLFRAARSITEIPDPVYHGTIATDRPVKKFYFLALALRRGLRDEKHLWRAEIDRDLFLNRCETASIGHFEHDHKFSPPREPMPWLRIRADRTVSKIPGVTDFSGRAEDEGEKHGIFANVGVIVREIRVQRITHDNVVFLRLNTKSW